MFWYVRIQTFGQAYEASLKTRLQPFVTSIRRTNTGAANVTALLQTVGMYSVIQHKGRQYNANSLSLTNLNAWIYWHKAEAVAISAVIDFKQAAWFMNATQFQGWVRMRCAYTLQPHSTRKHLLSRLKLACTTAHQTR
jgi:hypothetical protein